MASSTPRSFLALVLLLSLAPLASAHAADCAGNLALSCSPAFFGCSSYCTSSSAAGGGTVYVLPLTAGCTWTAVPAVPWIHVTSVDTSSTPQSFTFSTDANTGLSPRNGAIAVSGKSWTVRQAGTTTMSSGRVTNGLGAGVSGVLIDFSDVFIPDVTTNSTGDWQQTGFAVCNFTFATPKKTGLTFSPIRRSVSAGQFDRNFTSNP